MSKLEANQVDPATGTTLTLGTSGDTIAIPSGVTIANSGTATGFSTAGITSSADATAISIDSSEVVRLPVGVLRLQNSTTGTADTDGLLIEASGNDVYINNKENAGMYFRTNNTDRMLISSNGAVKIARNGAAVDSGDYHQIVGNSSNFYELKVLNKSSSPASQYIQEISFTASSPDGSGAKFMQMRDATTARVNINSDGDLQNHDNSYGGISDERVKQNIVDAGSQWNDIKNIRVRKYKKKDDVAQYGEENAQLEIGVISQELETVSPGLIKEDKPDSSHVSMHSDFSGDNPQNVKYVKYSILYMKSIKALQEAMERIETLETKVAELENA